MSQEIISAAATACKAYFASPPEPIADHMSALQDALSGTKASIGKKSKSITCCDHMEDYEIDQEVGDLIYYCGSCESYILFCNDCVDPDTHPRTVCLECGEELEL